MIIKDIEININIELSKPQSHENMAIVPIKSDVSYNLDILTLKKGFELGLVDVKECENNTVNTISVENKAVTPLLLIDGEEIIGANQNRIVNSTTLIEPKTTQNISVSCTEQGRWAYKNEFRQSKYMANFRTRRIKERSCRTTDNYQANIWNSIHDLETDYSFRSPTSAMSESYENLKKDHDEFLKAFEIIDGQTGVAIILDGEIKGFEIFYNAQIYKEYHEKILKSYLIDNKIQDNTFPFDSSEIENLISNISNSDFNKKESSGIESKYEFENDDGLGTVYTYKDEIIHWSFFKKSDEDIEEEIQPKNTPVEYVL